MVKLGKLSLGQLVVCALLLYAILSAMLLCCRLIIFWKGNAPALLCG
jgi:hypothetical protein